jgi:hypothetical protein
MIAVLNNVARKLLTSSMQTFVRLRQEKIQMKLLNFRPAAFRRQPCQPQARLRGKMRMLCGFHEVISDGKRRLEGFCRDNSGYRGHAVRRRRCRIRFANTGCSIPSLEVDNASVLDEFYWLDKDDRPASESIRPLCAARCHPNQ